MIEKSSIYPDNQSNSDYATPMSPSSSSHFQNLTTAPVSAVSPQAAEKSQRKKKSYFGVGCLAIILLAIFFTFIFPKIQDYFYNRKFANNEMAPTAEELLLDDFKNKKIDGDKYVQQLAYSIWDPGLLEESYKTKTYNPNPPDIISEVDLYKDNLSEETKRYLATKIFMTDVALGPEEAQPSSFGAKPTYASTLYKYRKRLDKVLVSSNNHFVVWYTEKGEDKSSYKEANAVADAMENTAAYYKTKYGMDFKFEANQSNPLRNTLDLKLVYKRMGLDPNLAESAMPIYLTNAADIGIESKSSYSAMYIRSIPPALELLFNIYFLKPGKDNIIIGMPILPYITIRPESVRKVGPIEFGSVSAHELFHHYQTQLCEEFNLNPAKNCNNLNGFTQESTANMAAANAYPKASFFKKYNLAAYFNTPHESLQSEHSDHYAGYGHYTFLKYLENIYGGNMAINTIIKDQDNPKRLPLENIYLKANGDFGKIFAGFATKNITNDYKEDSFNSDKLPRQEYKLENGSIRLPYAAINYFYLKRREFKNKILSITVAEDQVNKDSYITIMGKRNNNSFAFWKGSSYQVLKQVPLSGGAIIDFMEYKDHSDIIVIVSNGDIYKDHMEYSINYSDAKEFVAINEITIPDSIYSCQRIYYKNFIEAFTSILRSWSRELAVISNTNEDVIINGQSTNSELLQGAREFNALASEGDELAKNFGDSSVNICTREIKPLADTQALHKKAMDAVPGRKWVIADFIASDSDPNTKLSFALNNFLTGPLEAVLISTGFETNTLTRFFFE